MAVVIGHSQTKYLSQYLSEGYEVFAYPGYRTRQFLQESILYEVLPFFSVSLELYLFTNACYKN